MDGTGGNVFLKIVFQENKSILLWGWVVRMEPTRVFVKVKWVRER